MQENLPLDEGSSAHLLNRFWSSVRSEHLNSLTCCLIAGDALAREKYRSHGFTGPEIVKQARFNFHELRTMFITQHLMGLNGHFSDLVVSICSADCGGYNYPQVVINNSVVLTISATMEPSSLPEASKFRIKNSRINPKSNYFQPWLLAELDEFDESPSSISDDYCVSGEDRVNGIITYQSNLNYSLSNPQILFPHYGCLTKFDAEINLLDIMSDNVVPDNQPESDQDKDQSQIIRLREKPKPDIEADDIDEDQKEDEVG
jgi:hypothetical protein